MIGQYPTPVEPLPSLSTPGTKLWVKRDDLTGEAYGGNKVRKLEYILEQARRRRATRIVTFGAAGSHHVLATTLYGRREGFEVAAVLTPQPRSEHAMMNLRAGLALDLQPLPARSMLQAPVVLARALRRGDFVVGPGGSSAVGARGYVDAAAELSGQVARGELPTPDAIVVALGSGGTAAGLLAGCVGHGLPTRIVAVRIVSPILMGKLRTVLLAFRTGRYCELRVPIGRLMRRLEIQRHYLGKGYGWRTREGERATELAEQCGLLLDPTYTAKAFAATLDIVQSGRFHDVVYWHTLSRTSPSEILPNAPPLPAALDGLFV